MQFLTEIQRDILNFIRDYQKERGVAPTHREICDHFGFSSYGTVYKHLSLLQKKGLIRRDWNQKRGVELVEQPETRGTSSRESAPNARELPLFGYIAAGRPLDVEVSAETIGFSTEIWSSSPAASVPTTARWWSPMSTGRSRSSAFTRKGRRSGCSRRTP